ncbi:MAG: DUF547 domain-containing protein [Cellvibrionaceae bacterium]
MLYRLFSLFFLSILITLTTLANANANVADLFDEVLSPQIKDGFVRYDLIDKNKLDTLVAAVADYKIDIKGDEKTLAFYLNAYNILAVKGIVDGDGPHSLLSRYTFFKGNKYTVAGTEMNLDTLEHKVIRPLKEARVHFALVCAAASCPPLRSEAYRANILDEQLNDQAITFINNKDKNSFDAEKKRSNLSSIFKWFKEDFLLEADSLNQYIASFVKDESLKAALANNEFSVKFNKYDWSLNGKR